MNVSPSNSKITYGNRSTAKSDGTDAVIVKVRLRDYDNQPVPGRAVQLFTSTPGVIITQPPVTDSEGLAIGYVRSNAPGPVIVGARVFPPASSSSSSPSSSSSSASSQ